MATRTGSDPRGTLTPTEPPPRNVSAATRLEGLVGAGVAAVAAAVAMLLLRWSMEVRSLPERLLEWLLLFVPPVVFEAALQRFAFDAKRYALAACSGLVFLLLVRLGYMGLRRGWGIGGLASIGIGVWLFVMLIVMPLSSAGVFASELPGSAALPTALGYLAVGLSLSSVLGAWRVCVLGRHGRLTPDPGSSRRRLLVLAGGGLAAYVATWAGGVRVGAWRPIATDQQALVLSGDLDRLDLSQAHPQATAQEPRLPPATPQPTPAAATQQAEPPPSRALARNKDGVTLPAGRPDGQLAPALTSNADFYVVSKNAVDDPLLVADDWRLTIGGEVERPLELDYARLRALPAVELTATLECVSNMVGQPHLAPFGAELISTAVWKGARVRDILALAGGARSGTGWVSVLAADEYITALPLAALTSPDALLVYEMNGETLPREHGYPARLLVPGRYGMKCTKWVVGLRVAQREFLDWYGQRSWTRDGVVRTMSRIDVPADGGALTPGRHQIAGIAYAGSRNISRVEYSSDSGATWRAAEVLESPAPNQWVRWTGSFDLPPGGSATLLARATDGVGNQQVQAFSLPQPDGGTGWPSVQVHAATEQ